MASRPEEEPEERGKPASRERSLGEQRLVSSPCYYLLCPVSAACKIAGMWKTSCRSRPFCSPPLCSLSYADGDTYTNSTIPILMIPREIPPFRFVVLIIIITCLVCRITNMSMY